MTASAMAEQDITAYQYEWTIRNKASVLTFWRMTWYSLYMRTGGHLDLRRIRLQPSHTGWSTHVYVDGASSIPYENKPVVSLVICGLLSTTPQVITHLSTSGERTLERLFFLPFFISSSWFRRPLGLRGTIGLSTSWHCEIARLAETWRWRWS